MKKLNISDLQEIKPGDRLYIEYISNLFGVSMLTEVSSIDNFMIRLNVVRQNRELPEYDSIVLPIEPGMLFSYYNDQQTITNYYLLENKDSDLLEVRDKEQHMGYYQQQLDIQDQELQGLATKHDESRLEYYPDLEKLESIKL